MVDWKSLFNSGFVGAIGGALSGGIISWLFTKRKEKKDNSESIYAPLLTEFKNNLYKIDKRFLNNIDDKEWYRISQEDYLTHRVKSNLKKELENFYTNQLKSYKEAYKEACKEMYEIIIKQLHERWNEGYDMHAHTLIEPLYPSFIAEEILDNKTYLKNQLDSVNGHLKNKYKNLDSFFSECLKLLNNKKEIKIVREKRKEIIKFIIKFIPLLEKELK